MYTIEEVKEKILDLIDFGFKKTLRETEGLIKLDIKDEVVDVTIRIKNIHSEDENELKRALVRLVKISLGFKGIKMHFEPYDKEDAPIAFKDIRYIVIGSGKGGVGKSTVTANLAVALKRLGKKVAIIDADIYGPSIPNVFEMELNEVMANDEGKMLPLSSEGIEIISTEFFTDHEQPLMWRGGMLSKMLTHFFNDVCFSKDIEYLLVDLPPGTGDVAIDMKQFIPNSEMILVTSPHLASAQIACKAGYGALQLGQKLFGVIENMSYYVNPINEEKEYIFGNGGGQLCAMKLSTKLLGQIPIGQPSGSRHSIYEINDKIGQIYLEIASKIINEKE